MEIAQVLKINQNKFNNFLIYIGEKNKLWSSEFITNKIFLQNILIKWCNELFKLDVYTISFIKNQNKVTIFTKYPKKVDNFILLRPYEKILNKILKENNLDYTVYLADFSLMNLNSKITKECIIKTTLKAIKTEKQMVFAPMNKEARKLVNNTLSMFTSIHYKTIGRFGVKRIIVDFKKGDE